MFTSSYIKCTKHRVTNILEIFFALWSILILCNCDQKVTNQHSIKSFLGKFFFGWNDSINQIWRHKLADRNYKFFIPICETASTAKTKIYRFLFWNPPLLAILHLPRIMIMFKHKKCIKLVHVFNSIIFHTLNVHIRLQCIQIYRIVND